MIELWVLTFALILARVATFVALLPLFGQVPRLVKLGLACALACLWFGSVDATPAREVLHSAPGVSWLAFGVALGRNRMLSDVLSVYIKVLNAIPRVVLAPIFILLFFVVGFQPIVLHTTTEELPGRVLLAVDRSASMDVADPQRPAVDKLRLARALAVADDLCSKKQLDDWIRRYEDKTGPSWAGQSADADRAAHDRVCRRIDQLTRAQVG